MENSTYIQKKWMQFKVSALSASITALIIGGIPTQISASDIDIYQSGGTGAINIYFMADISGSMGSQSILADYPYDTEKTVCQLNYTQSSSGKKYIVFKNVGKGNGVYTPSGSNYNFVGSNKGTHIIEDIRDALKNDSNSAKYSEGKSECKTGVICSQDLLDNRNNWSGPTIKKDLQINGYTYAKENDAYCTVKESELDLSKIKDKQYYNKIQKICEKANDAGTEYRCLDRLSNLKKGFLQLINSAEIDKDHNFSLGQYTGANNNNGGTRTLLDFTSMDLKGKASISNLVQNLIAGGGTPIDKAYSEAISKITVGNAVSNAKPQCSGNGVYFLTDGEPNPSDSSLFGNTKAPDSTLTDYFKRMAGKGTDLRTGNKLIKTATVGFGGEYYLDSDYARNGEFDCSVYTNKNRYGLCSWGTKLKNYGQGGFYSAQSAEDLVGSIKQFVSDVSVPIEGSTMGTSTIPVDALNTTQLQSYSYFPMFKPLIGTKNQLWAGNLKKFKVSGGTIVDTQNKSVFDNDKIGTKLQDFWYSATGSSNDDQFMAWGGHLSRLKTFNLPKTETSSTTLNRNLYINIDGKLEKVSKVLESTQKPANSQYLYGLMGFSKLKTEDFTALNNKTYTEQLAYLKDKVNTASGYEMGSVIHSMPVLLTQKGSIEFEKGVQSSKDREDYIMFGTTQGVLHIVKAGQQNTDTPDTEGGKDVFSFVPQEFLANQSKGFAEALAMERTDSVDTFFYGVDGPWIAHTVYESSITDLYKKDENGNDVIENGEKVIESTRGSLVVKADSKKSHQYVYGGLRMGGRSYYALNLSDMTAPKMMFHINPAIATLNTDPLFHMGQSWSKPTLTYIKWNGKKKLAMIVGGGYDKKYEDPAFTNSTSGAVKGNGVYIFDAENGKLLWWGSSSIKEEDQSQATINTDDTVTKPESTSISTMVNSIPSRVKAVDRDGDGITDHLYVGDLGGKLFRIDLNPKHTISDKKDEKKPFILNAFALADLGNRRFYEAPTFTIHKSGMTRYAVLSLGSGDRSSPLVDSSLTDLLVGIYDTSVTETVPTVQSMVGLDSLREIYKGTAQSQGHKGWYYTLPKLKPKDIIYQQRILEEGVALDNSLYYPIFNPQSSTANVDATSCTGGITGESTLYQFCLPSGECVANQTAPKSGGSMGPGILGLAIGGTGNGDERTFIFNKEPGGDVDKFKPSNKLLPQRWFEYSPYKIKSDK